MPRSSSLGSEKMCIMRAMHAGTAFFRAAQRRNGETVAGTKGTLGDVTASLPLHIEKLGYGLFVIWLHKTYNIN